MAVYIVYDLPRAVPYNIGRKLHASLVAHSTDSALQRPNSFIVKESDRITKVSRSVIRECGYELHKRFQAALEKSESELKEVEGMQSEAEQAIEWLNKQFEAIEREEAKVQEVNLEELQ